MFSVVNSNQNIIFLLFSAINFQFSVLSKISSIQTHTKLGIYGPHTIVFEVKYSLWASNSILRIKHSKEIWDRAWTLSLTTINGGRSHLQTRARFLILGMRSFCSQSIFNHSVTDVLMITGRSTFTLWRIFIILSLSSISQLTIPIPYSRIRLMPWCYLLES